MNKPKSKNRVLTIVLCDFDDIRNSLLAAGQAIATKEFGARLAAKGHHIKILCSRYPGSKDRKEFGMEYVHIGLGTSNIKINNFAYIFALPFSVMRQRGDILIECFTAPMSTLCTPLFTRMPVVVIPSCFDAARFSKLYHFPFEIIERWGLGLYKYFLPYSQAILNKIQAVNPTAKYAIVPEGVGEEFFTIKRSAPKHILFLGRMDIEQKGIDLLLHAYKKAKPSLSLPLVVAGNGPQEQEVAQMVKKLGLSRDVTMTGSTYGEAKAKALSEAAFVVVPSRNETFSCFALEALASGSPLITFDIPGLSWTDAGSTLKAKSFEVNSLAQQLIEMEKKYSKMSKPAREFASHFSWDHMANDYESFFQKIVEGAL